MDKTLSKAQLEGNFLSFFLNFIYLRERVSEREQGGGGGGRGGGQEKQTSCKAWSQTQGSIPGRWDRDLGRGQTLND